jgi:hypothetical protein
MAKGGSSGRHGGGHKDRQRGANASDRKAAERATQARIRADRAQAQKDATAARKAANRQRRQGGTGGSIDPGTDGHGRQNPFSW